MHPVQTLEAARKKHPKVCKLFELEKACRFGLKCSYLHSKAKKQNETDQRLQYLENSLKDMTKKIESLEEELARVKANVIGVEEIAKEMPSEGKGQIFKCDICDYKTKKDVTLKKHKKTLSMVCLCVKSVDSTAIRKGL